MIKVQKRKEKYNKNYNKKLSRQLKVCLVCICDLFIFAKFFIIKYKLKKY